MIFILNIRSSYSLDDVPDAESLAGQPCNDYEGYCDVFKICRQVGTNLQSTGLH